jgi:acyl-coenzyme A thioesterase PaaI-like protein
MPESLRTRLQRWRYNLYPAYRGTGGRITYIAADWREVHVRIPLNWRTRNVVGTIYGGSLYGAVDPFFMLMLMENLGPEYVVWDKSASIRFKAPGRSTLHARFRLEPEELESIRQSLRLQPSVDRTYTVELLSQEGEVHVQVEKTIHVRRR